VSAPIRVCFVCTGNICRSPTAEVVFRRQVTSAGLAELISVSSAGLSGWHVGDGADTRSLATMSSHGYDGRAHRAQQWKHAWWDRHDVVIALDSGHQQQLAGVAPNGRRVALLRDYDPAVAGQHLDVPDPYYGGPDGFEDVLAMIETACMGLLDQLRGRLAA
jgi:protein-tyrosine phosphatase